MPHQLHKVVSYLSEIARAMLVGVGRCQKLNVPYALETNRDLVSNPKESLLDSRSPKVKLTAPRSASCTGTHQICPVDLILGAVIIRMLFNQEIRANPLRNLRRGLARTSRLAYLQTHLEG